MLLGEYRLSLDDEGRLSLPASVRQTLREMYAPDEDTLVITRFFEGCLVLYPRAEWLRALEQLQGDGAPRALLRSFRASAEVLTLDRQGRVCIPPAFRRYAEIDKEVFLVGMVRKLELWASHRWDTLEAR